MKKIRILIYGGLGNQLFQLAMAKSINKKFKDHDLEMLDLTSYAKVKRKWSLEFLKLKGKKINNFQYFFLKLKIKINNQLLKYGFKYDLFNIINESSFDVSSLYKYKNKSFILNGYWQSEKYFYEFRDEIKLFLLGSRIDTYNHDNNSENVALHIRLGDYMNFELSKKNHFVCDFSWYKKAIKYLYNINDNFKFIIFTDDPIFVRDKFKLNKKINYVIADKNEHPYIDFFRMSCCKHFIISNSSFSWWASYLGEEKNSFVVAPKFWYPKKLTSKMGIYRSNWILL